MPAGRHARVPAGGHERRAGVLLDQRGAAEGAAGGEMRAVEDRRARGAAEEGGTRLALCGAREGVRADGARATDGAGEARAHAQAHELDLALGQGVAVEALVRA